MKKEIEATSLSVDKNLTRNKHEKATAMCEDIMPDLKSWLVTRSNSRKLNHFDLCLFT